MYGSVQVLQLQKHNPCGIEEVVPKSFCSDEWSRGKQIRHPLAEE